MRKVDRGCRNRFLSVLVLFAFAFGGLLPLFSCGTKAEEDSELVTMLTSDFTRLAPDDDAPVDEMVESLNTFALTLLHELREENPSEANIVFSPTSLFVPLAVVRAGALGPTREQMSLALQTDLDDEDLLAAINTFEQRLMPEGNEDPPYKVKLTNGLWAQKDFRFQQTFVDLLAKYLGESLRVVDFVRDFVELRDEINAWVEEQTAGEIKDLLPEGTPDVDSRLMLINTLYFDAPWERVFEISGIGPFTTLAGEEVSTEMMKQMEANHFYTYRDDAHWLDLRTRGQRYSALIIMPDEDPVGFLSALSAQTIVDAREEMSGVRMELTVPQLDLDSFTKFVEPLKSMGMELPFLNEDANFGGIVDISDSETEGIYINDIGQRVVLRADQTRLTAVAATYVDMAQSGDPEADLTLRIDRPYYLFITDNETGAILFASWITDPS